MCIFDKPVPPATLSRAHVIKWIKRDIRVHKQCAERAGATGSFWGTRKWHNEAIEVFENAVHYLVNS